MAVKPIKLSDIWQPTNAESYKIHFARYNGKDQPLHVFTRSFDDWRKWNEWYPGKNDFNRPHIFSLMQFPSQPDLWMFGGIWDVVGVISNQNGSKEYEIFLSEQLSSMIGRLVLHRVHKGRGTRLKLETHFRFFEVSEILAERYKGRDFPGYHRVLLGFQELEAIISNDRQDWRTALVYVKGVYLITDTNTQRRYVGSAYGEWGIWSRWKTYSTRGDGGNIEMKKLLEGHDLEYCRAHFKFALLEHHDARTEDRFILEREAYWKNVLDTRHVESGLNRN